MIKNLMKKHSKNEREIVNGENSKKYCANADFDNFY
jgi:hypothetical protein